MALTKILWILLLNLPEILDLIKEMEDKNKELKTDMKIRDDLKLITKAFEVRDAKALENIFNS